MKFLDSSALWHLFWALPLLAAMTLWYFFRGKKLLRKIFPSGDPGEYSNVHYGKRIVRALLLLLAVAALGFALARPAWGVRKTESPVQTRDILIVLDISRSMLSDNVKPSRLDHARYLIRDMTENMPDTRFGIMAFAGNPVRVCPMTLDRTQLLNKLDAVSPADAPRGGTNLEAALNSAFNSVKYGSAGLNRAVVLISDGGELEGDYQKTFAKYKKEKIPVFTIGVGEPENPALIPLESGRLLRDNQGNTVNAPLQEDALQTIARETGGEYIRSTTINSGSAELRRALEKVVPEEKTLVAETDVERPALPLALAFIFLVCFFLLSERRKTAKIFLFTGCLLCLTLFSFAVEESAENTETAEQSEKKEDITEKTPTVIYNEALRTHKKGDTENAVKLYEQVISHKDSTPELRANAFLNMGVIRQTAARKIAEEALAPETTANPDGAIRKIDAALAGLDTAQEDYRNSLRTHSAGSRSTVKNQTLLIRDREKLEELKKKLEELKKQQQQAQQQTQQALQQQQQQQQQQAQQQQQQQQQAQQQQAQQQQAQQQTQQAQQDAEKLADQAEKLDQKQLAQNAKDAAEKLKDAQRQQKTGDQKGAERSIREALEKLGGGKDGQDQKDGQEGQEKNKDQDKNGKEENRNAPSSGKDGQEQKDGQEDDPSSEPSENKNDTGKDGKEKKEAGSPSDVRVDQMRRDNEKFRKEVEKIRKMRLQSLPVEKDW